MIKTRTILAISAFPVLTFLSACTPVEQENFLVSQVAEKSNGDVKNMKYPDSKMIYNVCHERWLRNGYKNYTFNLEEGRYDSGAEVQSGKFTQVVVANRKVSQAASCDLSYYEKGASCNQNTRRRSNNSATIEDFFAKWEKNPSLYQACHPVLGYPTGYGHTYGSGNRRIDSSNWLLISSVIPRRSSQVSKPNQVAQAESRTASPSRERPLSKNADYTSVTDLDIQVSSSYVLQDEKGSHLIAEFTVTNETSSPAILGIKGWMLDSGYERYPLAVDGHKPSNGNDAEIYTLKVEPHSQLSVSYEAEGVPDINVGRRTIAMLEIISADGVQMNLTLPNNK